MAVTIELLIQYLTWDVPSDFKWIEKCRERHIIILP